MIKSVSKTVWQFFKKLNTLTVKVSNLTPRYLPNWNENLCSHKYLYANAYSSFLCNHQNWKWPKGPSAREWINKPWHSQTVEYYLVSERNELLIPATTWVILKCIILKKKYKTQNSLNNMMPFTCHSCKGKTISKQIKSVVARNWKWGEGLTAKGHGGVWSVIKLFYMLTAVMMVTWRYMFAQTCEMPHYTK